MNLIRTCKGESSATAHKKDKKRYFGFMILRYYHVHS